MAFAVEISLTVARKDTSAIQIKNKQDLYQALTDREMFDMILEQGFDYVLSNKETFDDDTSRFNQLQKGDRDEIVDYFMNIKDKIKLDEFFDDLAYYASSHSSSGPFQYGNQSGNNT